MIDDVHRRIPTGLGLEPGETLILLGDTHDEFDGSIWSQVEHGHLGGVPPKVDLAREQLLADILLASSRDGLVTAAHDLSEGGLAQAVVEAALAGETGCRILIPEGADPFVTLFSESSGRVLVAVPRTEETRFTGMCTAPRLAVDAYRGSSTRAATPSRSRDTSPSRWPSSVRPSRERCPHCSGDRWSIPEN